MTRTRLRDRRLPDYTRGEERFNTVSHIVGGGLGVLALAVCVILATLHRDPWAVVGSAIYGAALVVLYTASSVYHGLHHPMAKKVMQVVDHCTIYFLIAGTYTGILLSAFIHTYPLLVWGLLVFEWAVSALAATLTAIDLKKYSVFSMLCYIVTGWAVIPFWRQTIHVLTKPGFLLLLLGGIAYTIGAVLYGIGAKKKWMHSVFHIFVVLGSLLQFLSIFLYAI